MTRDANRSIGLGVPCRFFFAERWNVLLLRAFRSSSFRVVPVGRSCFFSCVSTVQSLLPYELC